MKKNIFYIDKNCLTVHLTVANRFNKTKIKINACVCLFVCLFVRPLRVPHSLSQRIFDFILTELFVFVQILAILTAFPY